MRTKRWGHVDQFGRSKPNGIRRVFKGSRHHDGRPLPLNLQVRPQRAKPTFHSYRNSGSRLPWYGSYLESLDKLQRGKRVPFLLKATSKCVCSYIIEIQYKNKIRTIYKINTQDPTVAFGILHALKEYFTRDNLWLAQQR
jgi:hypothetical protein